MAVTSTVKAVSLSSFDTAGLAAGYAVVNATGLSHSCFKIRFINHSNVNVTVSYDGVNAHDIIAAGANVSLDFQNNAGPSGYVAMMPKGTKIFVSGGAGNGLFYVGGYYQI